MDAGDPRGAIWFAMDTIYDLALPLLILNVPVYLAHYKAARGTRLRYLAGALIPVMCIVGVFAFSARLIADTLALPDQSRWWLVMDASGIICWTWNWYGWKRFRDDDDFWNGLGKRISDWRSRRRTLRAIKAIIASGSR